MRAEETLETAWVKLLHSRLPRILQCSAASRRKAMQMGRSQSGQQRAFDEATGRDFVSKNLVSKNLVSNDRVSNGLAFDDQAFNDPPASRGVSPLRATGLAIVILFSAILHSSAQSAPEHNAAASAPAANSTPATDLPDNPLPQQAAGKKVLDKRAVDNRFFDKRVIDKKFIAVMGSLGAAESMRITTRTLVLDHEFAAGAPWVTSTPSHSHLVVKYAPIYGAELAFAYELKKPHHWLPGDRVLRHLWWTYPAIMTILHVKNSLGNIHTSAPTACPAPQC
jgi:hypothetical protein